MSTYVIELCDLPNQKYLQSTSQGLVKGIVLDNLLEQ